MVDELHFNKAVKKINRDRKTGRKTERQIIRKEDRQKDRLTDRKTDRKRDKRTEIERKSDRQRERDRINTDEGKEGRKESKRKKGRQIGRKAWPTENLELWYKPLIGTTLNLIQAKSSLFRNRNRGCWQVGERDRVKERSQTLVFLLAYTLHVNNGGTYREIEVCFN